MKHLLILAFAMAFTTSASLAADIGSDGIVISANNIPEELMIEVTPDVTGKVTLTVFSQRGDIVIERELTKGANRISVNRLPSGTYTAVVRENDEFRDKQAFQVD